MTKYVNPVCVLKKLNAENVKQKDLIYVVNFLHEHYSFK